MNWNLFLRYFLDSLFAVKYKLVLLLIVVVAFLGVYLMLEKPSYKTSWVVLLPGTERSSTINLDNLGEARSGGSNAYGSVSISPKNTYKEIALSDAVISAAAMQYGVDSVAFSKPRITLIDQTPAMKFTLIGEEKEELIYRAGLYNDTFHSTLDSLRKNEIERNYQGVEANLNEAKKRLAQARSDVVAHQTQSRFISDDQFKRWMSDAETLRTDKIKTQVSVAELQARIVTSLAQLGITADQAEAFLVLLSNPSLKVDLERLAEQLTEQISLRSQFASQNPERKKVEREVRALTQNIRNALTSVPGIDKISDAKLFGLLAQEAAKSIQTVAVWLAELDGLNAQYDALNTSQLAYEERIKTQTKNSAILADLQRDHQIEEAIFSSALAKLDTSRLDIYAIYPLTQLLTHPGATVVRDRLQSKLIIIGAFMIYGMLSLALILTSMRNSLLHKNKVGVTDEKKQTLKKQEGERETLQRGELTPVTQTSSGAFVPALL